MNQATQEIIPANLSEIKPFSKFESELATMKAANDKAVFNYADPKGAKEARSHIFSIRKVRAALETARKEAKAAALEYGRTVDAEAKRIEAELNSMIAVHETPLLEIEAKETARIEAIQKRVAELDAYKQIPASADSSVWGNELDKVSAFSIDATLEEFMAPAAIAKDAAITVIRERFLALVKQEEDARELARLKAEQQAREQQEREAKIAQEAADNARKEAEDKAESDRQAVREAEMQRQRDAEAAALKAKQDADAAVARAEKERADAERRAIEAEEAARRKVAQEQEDARIAAEKREANKRHLAKVNNAAATALVGHVVGMTEEMAKAVITVIARKEVPNVTINY